MDREMQKVAFLFDCEIKAIDAAMWTRNHQRLAELLDQYRRYANSMRTKNRNLWALMVEMATAAAELSLYGSDVECDDCGDTFTERKVANFADTRHICPECAKDREFHRAQGEWASEFD